MGNLPTSTTPPHSPINSPAMASFVTNQLILHPLVNDSLKVASTTVGRDKAYRTVQYAARALAWYYAQRGYPREAVAQMSAIKSALGTTRKVMRLGKPMEHFQAAVKAMTLADPILRVLAISRQLGYAFYLINDALVWAHSAKIKVYAKDRFARIQKAGTLATPEKEADRKVEIKALRTQYYATRYQLIQDLCDFTLPMSSLGYFNLNEGVLGVAGLISSLMGLQTQKRKVLGK